MTAISSHAPAHPRGASRQAVTDVLPFLVALVPFSLAIGTASAGANLSLPEMAFGAATMLAGSAQLAAIELIGDGEAPWLAAGTAVLVNVRFAFYGAGLGRWFQDLSVRRRLLLAIPLVDQTFLLCEERFSGPLPAAWRQRYYVTASGALISVFLGSQIVGYRLGAGLAEGLGLHLAAPLAFAGMLAKAASGRANVVAACAAGVATVVLAGIAGSGALPLAVLVGITIGLRWGG